MKILKPFQGRFFAFAGGLALTALLIHVVISPLFTFSNFYDELDDFKFHSRNDNDTEMKRSLNKLDHYYKRDHVKIPLLSRAFKWFSDNYVFSNASAYRAAHSYEIGDYETVYSETGDRNDHLALHLIGSAKFRGLQKEYAEAVKSKSGEELEALKEELIRRGQEEIGPYFKRALRAKPDDDDYKWNYDLIMDPNSLSSALEGNKKPKLFILGLPEGENPNKDDENFKLDEKTRQGQSDSDRKS